MIYNLSCFIVWLLAIPFLLIATFKKKYKNSILARFFLYKNPPLKEAKYHIHACSLGEVASIKHLFNELGDARLSVTTQTGFNEAKKFTDKISFLPFECFLPFYFSKCDTLIVFEAELWLNLFRVAKNKGARTILLNARISDKSYKSYLRFKFYYKMIFANIDLVLAQSQTDKERLASLGAKNIKVVGNIKSANLPKKTKTYIKPSKHVITLASSHKNEEKKILENIILKDDESLFIVPRHPERFSEVEKLALNFAKKHNYSFEKFSDGKKLNSKINLIDAMGELVNIYAISDIVVLCGSFEKNIGGHNPIEAAQFDCGIISGKFIHNQRSLFTAVSDIKMADYGQLNNLIHQNFKSKIINSCDFDEVLKLIKG